MINQIRFTGLINQIRLTGLIDQIRFTGLIDQIRFTGLINQIRLTGFRQKGKTFTGVSDLFSYIISDEDLGFVIWVIS